jgi:hemolysin activation/secretion protein
MSATNAQPDQDMVTSPLILADTESSTKKSDDQSVPENAPKEAAPASLSENEAPNTAKKSSEGTEAQYSFNVFEFVVDGNTVLENTHIEKAVYPFLGETKTIKDVEKARAALESTYQNLGYLTVSVSIPEQDVDDGIVRLLVTEGSVERLRIKDAQYTTHAALKSRVQEFEEGKVPHFPTAQAQLDKVSRNQNRQVSPILRPGKSPGKVEVDLQVQDKLPLHGSLELNDRFAPSTTRTRLNGSMRYENLWQKDHSMGISFQASPEDFNEVKVFSGTYVIPRQNGDYFAMYAVVSDSNIAAVGDVNVIGNGRISGARYIHPLKGADNYYHSVTLGADYKDFKESVILLGADTTINAPVSYFSFSLGYDGTIQTDDYQTQMNVTMNAAPRAIGNTEREFNYRRQNAKPNFAYIRSEVKHLHKLPYDWTVQTRLLGQLSNGGLIAPEQFAVGGVDSVRGYLESSSLGDNGIQLALELRTPPLKKYLKQFKASDYLKDFYLFSFYDAGLVKVYNSPNAQSSQHVSSAGIGLKLKTNSGVLAYIDYAYAFQDSIQVNAGDERLHFRLGYEW